MTLSLLLTTLTPFLSAQVGGERHLIHEWTGGSVQRFADSVANAGDVNGDGVPDQIVGIPKWKQTGSVDQGKVRVFSGSDFSELYVWNGVQNGDRYGQAVAGVGDVNADGFDDVAVFKIGGNGAGSQGKGTVDIRSGASGAVLYQWTGNRDGALFGNSIASVGDINQDGYADVLIGAPGGTYQGIVNAGYASVHSGFDGSVLLQVGTGVMGDAFGSSVAAAGDLNQDGTVDLWIGAPDKRFGGFFPKGAALAYSGADGSLLFQVDGTQNNQALGHSVCGVGDINDDGIGDVMVGAPGERVQGVDGVGVARIYSGADQSVLVALTGTRADEHFGGLVASSGDTNGDGIGDYYVVAGGTVHLVSGIDLRLLSKWDTVKSVCNAGDVDGDGNADILTGNPGDFISAEMTLSCFQPYLQSSQNSVSASVGGTLTFSFDFPNQAAGYGYATLLSASGTGPFVHGIYIPLTLDSLVADCAAGRYPVPTHVGLQGNLDFEGDAIGSMQIPAGLSASLVGRVFHVAAVAFPTGLLPTYSSISLPITVDP